MINTPQIKRIEFLDGLRGIAILFVLFFHYYTNVYILSHIKNDSFVNIFKYGNMGVFLFFLISGFVIFMTLEKSNSQLGFIQKRYIRLLPGILFMVVFIYTYKYIFQGFKFDYSAILNILPAVSLIHPIFFEKITGINFLSIEGVLWTLHLEFLFYIIFSSLYFLFKKKISLLLLFFLSLLTFLLKVFTYYQISKNHFINNSFELIHSVGLEHLSWFFAGAVGYIYYNNRNNKNLLLFISSLFFASVSYGHLVAFIFVAIFFTAIQFKFIQRFLELKILIFFGFISYPLYLIHNEFGIYFISQIKNFFSDRYLLLVPVIVTLPVVVLSYLAASFFEPFVKKVLVKILN